MAGKALAVEKEKEILRLKSLGVSDRQIAKAIGVSRHTIKKYFELDQTGVDAQGASVEVSVRHWSDDLNWPQILSEASKGVPLQILWQELVDKNEVSVQYPAFWKQLRKREPHLPATMVRVFTPGERGEIDYCDGIPIYDPITGEMQRTHLFVGVLCHSRYAFAEFSLTQNSQDFLNSHVRMFDFFGGIPKSLAPDNLKSAVAKAHRYDPVINPAYTRLAEHYEFAVVPARVRRPKDKALVERTIQIFQRWFFFAVRHRRFTSLIELNHALKVHLEAFNARRHRVFRRTRSEMFAAEREHLSPLPHHQYAVATHHRATLHADCHVVFEKNYYSAPHEHRGKNLDLWVSSATIEIYLENKRIAMHPRKPSYRGIFETDKRHYPDQHQAWIDTTPKYLRDMAAKSGPETSSLIHQLLSGPYPLQYVRRCQGIIRLGDRFGKDRLERAVSKATALRVKTYQGIERILRNDRYWGDPRPTTVTINRGHNEYLRGEDLLCPEHLGVEQ
jgi:transposase